MIYKLASENHIPALSEMRWIHEFEEHGEFQISKEKFISECNSFLLEGLKTNTWAYWIAEEDGVIVSNIYIRRIRKVPKPQKLYAEIGYVTNVHTKEDFRNKGVGLQLLKHAKQWAVDNNIELLFVWPSKRAVSFYEREGFSMKNEIMELELS